jgi:prepilin-type N-terminal cleavage/methylation domain-containing protein/prepilin-type processing-associated H-X9-DG protein
METAGAARLGRGKDATMMFTRRTPRSGFTLIELLVVIAIIAILAAILFPVFAQARDSARQTTCLNNLKQLGTGLMMYAQDYDENMPAWPFRSGAGGLFNDTRFKDWSYSTWVDAVMPYVKNQGVFACPNGPKLMVGPKGNQFVVNLAINEYIENSDNGYASIARLSGARNGPADVTVVAESNVPGIYQDWSDGLKIPGKPNNFGLYRMYCANKAASNVCEQRHQEHGVNVVYADGHAKFVPGGRIQGGAADKREYPIVNPNIEPWQ